MSSDEIIRAEHLKKYFPVEKGFLERLLTSSRRFVKAVDDVSFSINKGEVFTLVGESGCGKSTTGRLVVRLLEPTSGRVFFEQQNITAMNKGTFREYRRKLQIIFQDPYASLNPRMKVGQAVGHPLEIHHLEKSEGKRKRVLEILQRVGLTPPEQFVNLYPHQLSGGQRQRVAMARSLILNPEFIVADEPVSMIDVSLRTTIIDLMLELRKEFDLTYLFITHDLAIAKYISNRIAIMYLGKIVEMGDKSEIFSNPIHPYTQALMSSIPIPNPERKQKVIELKGEVSSAIDIPKGCRFNPRCPYADKKCKASEPELLPVKPEHFVACYRTQTGSMYRERPSYT
jgi:peptide/nickel transport system ATP-binding protein